MTTNTFELSVTLKGTNKSALRRKLMEIVEEFDDGYGKPRQGTYVEFDVESKIVTPLWDGKEY